MGLFNRKYKPVFITTKGAFTVTLVVMALTIIIVWLQGLHLERSVLRNTMLSTSILSSFLFLFMLIGLYRGYKLKDNLGAITDSFNMGVTSDFIDLNPSIDIDLDIDIDDGCGEIIGSILLWILVSIMLGVLIFIFSTIVWFSILLLLALLYWVFFRGLRLVFKRSPICQGNFMLSLRYAISYTSLSTLWLLMILFVAEHQNYSLSAFWALFN